MFAGIVEEQARISRVELEESGGTIALESSLDHSETKLGDSIAINGVCLTVVEIKDSTLSFDLCSETMRCTALSTLAVGTKVNIERSLQVGERISGHFVFGHVDGVATLKSKSVEGDGFKLVWDYPSELSKFLAPKGSVTLSGVSLTVGEVSDSTMSVYIIPHTADVTTLGGLSVGEKVNIEIDMLARYVVSAVSAKG